MLRKTGTAIALALCMGLLLSTAVFADEASTPTQNPVQEVQASWTKTQDNKHWMYNDGTTDIKNKVIEINGKTYGFDAQGYMVTGYAKIAGKEYFFTTTGNNPEQDKLGSAVQSCWQKIETGKYYYFGKTYVRDTSKTGWQKIDGKIYYLNKSGIASTGLKTISKKKFYFKKDGSMVTGPQKISGKIYLFSASGALGTKGAQIKGSGWKKVSGTYYYMNSNGTLKTGWMRLKGKRYYLNKKTGARTTGWQYIGKYKYYFDKKGKLVQDVSSKIGKQSSYYITVNRKTCVVTIYAKDGSKGYTIPVKAMTCSVGKSGTATPKGTFKTMAKYRWKVLMGPSYGQYSTRITGSILFHSVAGYNRTSYNLKASDYNMLGKPASHGCVRLTVRDAKWIYDNCSLGTTVKITDSCAQPFDKPTTTKIKASQHYDPTDPNVKK